MDERLFKYLDAMLKLQIIQTSAIVSDSENMSENVKGATITNIIEIGVGVLTFDE